MRLLLHVAVISDRRNLYAYGGCLHLRSTRYISEIFLELYIRLNSPMVPLPHATKFAANNLQNLINLRRIYLRLARGLGSTNH